MQRTPGVSKALLIGVNYRGQARPLEGCLNDATSVRDTLVKDFGFEPREGHNYLFLTEEQPRRFHPTRDNILKGVNWLVQGAQAGDVLWMHFSGHGVQVKDLDGDESDGMDEAIAPLDYGKAGMITDDELKLALVDPLPAGVVLYAVFDCCHSGTILDLCYSYDAKKRRFRANPRVQVQNDAEVFMISGCLSQQESADLQPTAGNLSGSVGALTHSLMPLLRRGLDWDSLMRELNEKMQVSQLPQVPQLEASHDVDPRRAIAFKHVLLEESTKFYNKPNSLSSCYSFRSDSLKKAEYVKSLWIFLII